MSYFSWSERETCLISPEARQTVPRYVVCISINRSVHLAASKVAFNSDGRNMAVGSTRALPDGIDASHLKGKMLSNVGCSMKVSLIPESE